MVKGAASASREFPALAPGQDRPGGPTIAQTSSIGSPALAAALLYASCGEQNSTRRQVRRGPAIPPAETD